MWRHLDKVADKTLAKYPTTLVDDLKLIHRDDEEDILGMNKRNCVLYRKSEKELLYFLKSCAKRVESLIITTPQHALYEIE